MRAPCKIEGCEKESRGRGWCSTHWLRWRTHGDPLMVKRPGVDYMTKGVCSVADCGKPNHARDLCSKHLTRMNKHGDPSVIGERAGRPLKGDVPTWAAIHKRLSRNRGPAANHACVDCGKCAREWSYNGTDKAELLGKSGGFVIAYSLSLSNYDPRCVSCHRKFDGAGSRHRDAGGRFAAKDDGQVVDVHASKRYADDKPGVRVKVNAA